jgi:uncharacterized protein
MADTHADTPRDDPDRRLKRIVASYRENPAVEQKAQIGLVTEVLGDTDWLTGPGDDAAAVRLGTGHVLAAGEAMWPAFVEADPFGAGIGAVVANVNDIAAMGGRCLGIIDTIVGSEELAREVLRGLMYAAGIYAVPVLGGHLTVHAGPPSLSAFAIGRTDAVLASRNAAPGQQLLFAGCLEGELRRDFPFFPSFRERGTKVPGDLEVIAALAEAGDGVAAKDVSMAGLLGSLAMLLEPSACGTAVDLDVLPRPEGVSVEAWVGVFPSYGFLLCSPVDRVHAVIERFEARELACAVIGELDDTGELRIGSGGQERVIGPVRGITGLRGTPGR